MIIVYLRWLFPAIYVFHFNVGNIFDLKFSFVESNCIALFYAINVKV